MQEIKAFIRSEKVDKVLHELENKGITGMTVIDVMSVGPGMIAPDKAKYSMKYVERFSQVAKLELVCHDEDVDGIINLVKVAAHTGHPGDGLIYVTGVKKIVKVRTGKSGDEVIEKISE